MLTDTPALEATTIFEHQREMLLIEPTADRLVFTFFEEPYAPRRWTRTCSTEAGFSTLEYFLTHAKKWWVAPLSSSNA